MIRLKPNEPMDQRTRIDPVRPPPFGVVLRLATNVSRAPRSGLLRSRLRHAILFHVMYRDVSVFPFRLFVATGDSVARLGSPDGISVQATIVLGNEHQSREGHIVNGVMCVA